MNIVDIENKIWYHKCINKRKECFDMINWKQMFNAKERQDASEDEWSEYTDITLQKFMTSDFMQAFADDCSNAMKKSGRKDFDDYSAIKLEMSSVLEEFGYPPFSALEDAYSEEQQLKMLLEFKEKYLSFR